MNETTTMAVGGMHCDGCVDSVNKALLRVEGVISAAAELDVGEALVTYDPSRVSIDDLQEAIEDAGFEVP